MREDFESSGIYSYNKAISQININRQRRSIYFSSYYAIQHAWLSTTATTTITKQLICQKEKKTQSEETKKQRSSITGFRIQT